MMERTFTEEVSTLEGRSVLEELIPTASPGWNTTQAEVLSVYGKLCFFLLVLHGLKHFASVSELSSLLSGLLSPCK